MDSLVVRALSYLFVILLVLGCARGGGLHGGWHLGGFGGGGHTFPGGDIIINTKRTEKKGLIFKKTHQVAGPSYHVKTVHHVQKIAPGGQYLGHYGGLHKVHHGW